MRKSNSKETRRAVEAYVLEELDNRRDNYDDPDTMRPVSWAFGILRSEMRYQSDQTETGYPIYGVGLAAKRHKAGRYGFITADTPYWVAYLAVSAGCFDCDYYYQRAAVAQWMDETPEEAARYSNDEVFTKYRHMFSQAFERLYDRETTPHRIPTSEFRRIFEDARPNDCFFTRKSMRYHRQTMRDITVSGYHMHADPLGTVHDCYKVESRQSSDPESPRHLIVYYFDRATLELVNIEDGDPKTDA